MKLYRFVIKVLTPVVKLLLRVRIIDERTNVNPRKPYIICANHMSNWDPILTVISTGLPINFMAKESLFKVPLLSSFIRYFGAFPVSRSGNDITAIKRSVEIIKSGGCFSLFPQGKRMRCKPMPEQAKKGVGFICARSGAGVLPVGIYTKGYRIKLFKPVTVRIGDVIPFDQIDFGENGNDYLLASQKIFERICELSQPID